MSHVIKEAITITAFIFVMMLLIEYINVLTRGDWQNRVREHKWGQYVLAAALGALPGCLGPFAIVSMYAHRMLSFGAVVSAMIATSGDESFVMLAMVPKEGLLITLTLFILGIFSGALTDILIGGKTLFQNAICEGYAFHPDEQCECFPPWEKIMVTPIQPKELILGKTIPFALIGFMDVILISLITVFWFEVPIRGNPLLLLFSAGLYLMTTLGIGLFISTISRTQQQAMMTAFFFILPAVLLSGFVFPIEFMPEPVQWVTFLNPMRYFLVIIRGTFLKGVGFDILWPQMVALFIIGTFTLGLTINRFRKTLS
jgi:hypothetical protein